MTISDGGFTPTQSHQGYNQGYGGSGGGANFSSAAGHVNVN